MESVNNIAILHGMVTEPPRFSHMGGTDKYMTFPLKIGRLSGKCDLINIIAREDMLTGHEITEKKRLYITGEVRSFNNKTGEGSRLVITVFAKEIECSDDDSLNSIVLRGVICKPPTLRRTPMGRLICDIMLAVNRRYGRSDYLPCIAWGRVAQVLAERNVGDDVCLLGRMQSRHYIKATETGPEERTAYEISIISLDEA